METLNHNHAASPWATVPMPPITTIINRGSTADSASLVLFASPVALATAGKRTNSSCATL